MKISFCTTCMGRLHHLQQTLPQNIRDNLPRKNAEDPQVEFVVLDYNSPDGLEDWIKTNPEMQYHMATKTLVYAKTREPEFFKMAHAKNMAHRLASGDIVCNLDADNFTGPHFAALLADIFTKEPNSVVHPSRRMTQGESFEDRGFFGRIAVQRSAFFDLGGYNETRFKGWGSEDTHFLLRAYAMGLKPASIFDRKHFGVIAHSNQARIENMEHKDISLKNIQRTVGDYWYKEIDQIVNRLHMAFSLAQSNRDGNFGVGVVAMGVGCDRVCIPPVPQARIDMTFAFNGISGFYESLAHTPRGDEPSSAHTPR